MVFVHRMNIDKCFDLKSMMKVLIYMIYSLIANVFWRPLFDQVIESILFHRKICFLTGHPRFINQLSQGVDMISLVGEIITSSVNTNMFTYEVAPVFNLMEESVLAHMRQCCGWSNDESSSKNGDGVLAPGGAISNLYAVLAARQYAFPEIKQSGIRDGIRPAMVISKHVK